MPQIEFVDEDLGRWIAPRVTPPRSAGHHVSDVLVRMLKIASRKFDHYGKTEAEGGIPLETREAMWKLGFIWEDVMADILRQQLAGPADGIVLPAAELVRDGIYGTPDRVILRMLDPGWQLEETKVTWMSTREISATPNLILEVPKFAYWTLQIKTYASMIADPSVRMAAWAFTRPGFADSRSDIALDRFLDWTPPICVLRSLFINADYKKFLPTPICWKIQWSLEELNAHWSMMRSFIERETAQQEPPNVERRNPDPTEFPGT
jgi:hypothetical protein